MRSQRTSRLGIRLTPEELAFIEEQAKGTGHTVSEFIRKRAFGKRIVSRADLQFLNEVRRLGGLQKHLASIYPSQKAEFGRVLNEIILFLRNAQ